VSGIPVSSTSDTIPESPARKPLPAWAVTERAVRGDLEALPADTPFLDSLAAIALALAREIDDAEGKTSRAGAAKQLTEVIRELKQRAGGGDSFADLLALLGTPLVSASDPTVHDAPKSGKRDARPEG